MADTIMTVVGNVVDEPRRRETKNGYAVTNFRVASTSRRFDREKEQFVDSGTLFVNITCWRALADNVNNSIRKGQPVIVTGRYYMREYKVEEQLRTAYELEASAVGHDLARGTTQFTRVYQSGPTVTIERDGEGLPTDDSDHWLNLSAASSSGDGEGANSGPLIAPAASDERELATAS